MPIYRTFQPITPHHDRIARPVPHGLRPDGPHPSRARHFPIAAGLGATGASARFRIYVVLTTGNERGSETVTVTRP